VDRPAPRHPRCDSLSFGLPRLGDPRSVTREHVVLPVLPDDGDVDARAAQRTGFGAREVLAGVVAQVANGEPVAVAPHHTRRGPAPGVVDAGRDTRERVVGGGEIALSIERWATRAEDEGYGDDVCPRLRVGGSFHAPAPWQARLQ